MAFTLNSLGPFMPVPATLSSQRLEETSIQLRGPRNPTLSGGIH